MDWAVGTLDRDSIVAFASCALLLVLGSIPALRGRRVLSVPLAACVGLILGTALVGGLLEHVLELAPRDSKPTQRVKHAAEVLMLQREHPHRNVLFLSGGSQVKRGVDTSALERELRRRGYDACVVNLGVGGFNHFERDQQAADLLRLLHERRILPRDADAKRQNWLLLAEAQAGYDRRPLANFRGVRDTARGYHYLSPTHAWAAFRAASAGGADLREDEIEWWDVGRHAAVHSFYAGAVDRLVPFASVQSHDGYEPKPPGRRLRFNGTGDAGRASRHPGKKLAEPSWVQSVYLPMLNERWRAHVDGIAHFAVPATYSSYITYSLDFCESTSEPCIALDDPKLLSKLDQGRYWHDNGHLAKSGAKLYTRWLAKRLAALGILER